MRGVGVTIKREREYERRRYEKWQQRQATCANLKKGSLSIELSKH